jgi:hypothetical protein
MKELDVLVDAAGSISTRLGGEWRDGFLAGLRRAKLIVDAGTLGQIHDEAYRAGHAAGVRLGRAQFEGTEIAEVHRVNRSLKEEIAHLKEALVEAHRDNSALRHKLEHAKAVLR